MKILDTSARRLVQASELSDDKLDISTGWAYRTLEFRASIRAKVSEKGQARQLVSTVCDSPQKWEYKLLIQNPVWHII